MITDDSEYVDVGDVTYAALCADLRRAAKNWDDPQPEKPGNQVASLLRGAAQDLEGRGVSRRQFQERCAALYGQVVRMSRALNSFALAAAERGLWRDLDEEFRTEVEALCAPEAIASPPPGDVVREKAKTSWIGWTDEDVEKEVSEWPDGTPPSLGQDELEQMAIRQNRDLCVELANARSTRDAALLLAKQSEAKLADAETYILRLNDDRCRLRRVAAVDEKIEKPPGAHLHTCSETAGLERARKELGGALVAAQSRAEQAEADLAEFVEARDGALSSLGSDKLGQMVVEVERARKATWEAAAKARAEQAERDLAAAQTLARAERAERDIESIAKVCTVQVLAALPLDARAQIFSALPPDTQERLRNDRTLLLSKAGR